MEVVYWLAWIKLLTDLDGELIWSGTFYGEIKLNLQLV